MPSIQKSTYIKLLSSFSKLLFWFSIVFSLAYMPCLFAGAFGNEVNLKVDVYSGNIVWEKIIDYSDASPVISDVKIYDNQSITSVVELPDSNLMALELVSSARLAESNLININSSIRSKYLVYHLLPTSFRILILLSSLLILLFFVLIMYCLKKFLQQIVSGDYFELKTMNYLRQLSYLLFLIWTVDIASSFILESFEHTSTMSHVSIVLDFPSVSLLFMGLVLWVLAYVFSQGIILKEDVKLTI